MTEAGPFAADPPLTSIPESKIPKIHRPLGYALAAAKRGWHVFPLTPGGKRPLKGFTNWEREATTDPELIRRCWSAAPYNIGISCGPSGLVVVDLDTPKTDERPPSPWDQPGVNEGADVLALICTVAEQPLPFDTFTVRTRRGGTHLYFTPPAELSLGNTAGRLGWLIDTRAQGGYVVGPGSFVDLPDGVGSYDVINGEPVAELPQWLAERLAPDRAEPRRDHISARRLLVALDGRGAGYAKAALREEVQNVLDAVPGTRNHAVNSAAFALGQLVTANLLPFGLVEEMLHAAAHEIGLPPREAASTIRSGLEAGTRQPRRRNS
ncbi:bifunctional DNA primase/polymerase [Nonomuraea sp. NN258]|uniref:bifunctional DNA primase/polymerase n=1 Tax=Nonomuraea antri TaxID=2730852 RepID=UPI0015696F6F|nr:bifunctional DNA primase/polymerase [Nonomuraea antri]NRQ30682.1 bifunctional DNA primase/polymerase [Nonomuraea antri]